MSKRFLALLLFAALLVPSCVSAQTLDVFGMKVDANTRVLDFDAAQIQVTDAQALSALIEQMPDLQEVLMFDSAMAREDMEWLFDTYPHIFFGWTIRFSVHTLRTDATAFSTLHASALPKPDTHHKTKDVSILRLCKRLKALDLGHNKLTDLSFLSGLTDLRLLIISPNYGITDFTPLASLTQLEYLEAFSTDVKDVSPLSGLVNLRDLNLACSDQLKDLSPLYELPNLERFWCGRGKIPQEQQRLMEEKHPQCQFDWKSQPTLGGWREHPHYDVLHAMFKGTEYIPFD